MTHEIIANGIGVRRVTVTEAANKLRRDGILFYSRGLINIPDRARLEVRCCECYKTVIDQVERLLPHIDTAPAWYA